MFSPIALAPPPKIAKGLFELPHPAFEPLKRVPYDSIYVLVPIVTALQSFLLLLSEASLTIMITTTNANVDATWNSNNSICFRRIRL